MKRALFASLVALTAATPALAQDFPPAPPIAEPKPFRLPATETYTLANGMQVTLIPYGVAPKTVVTLQIRAGNDVEGGNTWLADLTGEMLKQGAGRRSSDDLSTAAAGMGGDLAIGVGPQATTIGLNILSDYAPDAIALIGDVAIRPTLPGAEFARLKANMQRNLALSLSQPGMLANIALGRTIYGPEHPYGRLVPTAAQLGGYTLEQVKAFHAGQYGARRAHLYVAGRFDAAAVKAAIDKAFGGWKPGPEVFTLASPHRAGPKMVLIDRPGAPQTTLRLAFDGALAGSEADIPQRVTNALLGGAFSSRITTNIREDKGYTYSPGSDVGFHPGEALWSFEADVTTAVTGPALSEVFKEIRRMQTEPASGEESKGIRTYLAGTFAIRNSTSGAVVGTLAERDLLGLPADWTDRYVPSVLAVDPAQMMASAKASYPLDKLVLVAVGDLKTIEPQLKALPELANIPFEHVTVP